MRLLGIPETFTRDGHLIVKPREANVLRLVNTLVYDSMGRKVGRVVDVIGRISDPRLVVKLDYADLAEVFVTRSEPLYYQITRKREKKSR